MSNSSSAHSTRRASKKNKIYGEAWKLARERANLTQSQVASALGYASGQFISNVEAGRCRFPSAQLPKIRKLYALSVSELIDMVLTEEEDLLRAMLTSE